MRKTSSINYISIEKIKKLLDSITSNRDKLIIKILFETGCTVNELVKIKILDIDFINNLINFSKTSTKSHKNKTSSISHSLVSELKKYVDDSRQEYLFSTRQSSLMTTKRVRQIIQFYGSKAGFPTKLNPQILRYSHIAHALESGISLKAIQKQTGLEQLRLRQISEEILSEDFEDVYKDFFEK